MGFHMMLKMMPGGSVCSRPGAIYMLKNTKPVLIKSVFKQCFQFNLPQMIEVKRAFREY